MAMTKVVEVLKAEVQRLNKAIALLEGSDTSPSKINTKRVSRKMSPEAIEKIRASQKKRWAAIKKKAPTSKKGS